MKTQAKKSIVNDRLKPEVPGVDVPIYASANSLSDAFRNPKFIDRSVAIECLRNVMIKRKESPVAIVETTRDCGTWKRMRPCLGKTRTPNTVDIRFGHAMTDRNFTIDYSFFLHVGG